MCLSRYSVKRFARMADDQDYEEVDDFFPSITGVKELNASYFDLKDKRAPIALKERPDDPNGSDPATIPYIVLFYQADNEECQNLRDIWARLAPQLPTVQFAVLNTARQDSVMKAFAKIASDPDNPYYTFRIQSVPKILVYRKGVPQAFYNGDRDEGSILDWAQSLAWKVGYYEPIDESYDQDLDTQLENDYDETENGRAEDQ